jgi:hypothetical protein
MRLSDAKHELRAIGVSINKKDGEYRVALAGTKGDVGVYFTDDLRDAVITAKRQWA